MTQQYDNNMSGALFKNNRRQSDRSPEYSGSCEINGQEFWVSAWVKEGRNGKFFSLAFNPKEHQQASMAPQQAPQPQGGFDGDEGEDIPF